MDLFVAFSCVLMVCCLFVGIAVCLLGLFIWFCVGLWFNFCCGLNGVLFG